MKFAYHLKQSFHPSPPEIQWFLYKDVISGGHLILIECPPLVSYQDGNLSAATLKWNLHAQREYQF